MTTNNQHATPPQSKPSGQPGYPEKQPRDKRDAQQEVKQKPASPDDDGNPADAGVDD